MKGCSSYRVPLEACAVAVMGSPSGSPTSVVLGRSSGGHVADTGPVILRTGIRTPAPAQHRRAERHLVPARRGGTTAHHPWPGEASSGGGCHAGDRLVEEL